MSTSRDEIVVIENKKLEDKRVNNWKENSKFPGYVECYSIKTNTFRISYVKKGKERKRAKKIGNLQANLNHRKVSL